MGIAQHAAGCRARSRVLQRRGPIAVRCGVIAIGGIKARGGVHRAVVLLVLFVQQAVGIIVVENLIEGGAAGVVARDGKKFAADLVLVGEARHGRVQVGRVSGGNRGAFGEQPAGSVVRIIVGCLGLILHRGHLALPIVGILYLIVNPVAAVAESLAYGVVGVRGIAVDRGRDQVVTAQSRARGCGQGVVNILGGLRARVCRYRTCRHEVGGVVNLTGDDVRIGTAGDAVVLDNPDRPLVWFPLYSFSGILFLDTRSDQ